jgi:hypothetical protein
MHPKTGVLDNTTLLFSSSKPKSLHTVTHNPQPLHLAGVILIAAFSLALVVGIAISLSLATTIVTHLKLGNQDILRGGAQEFIVR